MIETTSSSANTRRGQKAKGKPANPIESAIISWTEQLPVELSVHVQTQVNNLITHSPKRWVVYFPLVLLPSGSFGEEWWNHLEPTFPEMHKDELWKKILKGISKREGKGNLTHLAVNAGIPLHKIVGQDEENILRTPSGLIMLHGDFGPDLDPRQPPTQKDFDEAFWVNTRQNGITQIWAPRYTMFSRGNIKEKARLLDFHGPNKALKSRRSSQRDLSQQTAVDLYAGIGYFVFSYVKMGMGRVIGWELNPWSVEGLRRGALANGWSVKVLRKGESLELGNEKIVVVLEDNSLAAERLDGLAIDKISHINCGLLPSSKSSWEMASKILNSEGWLHLHENVGVNDTAQRYGEIERTLQEILARSNDPKEVRVEHTELVKTFAPGVWHCVFDVFIFKPA
jgi:tRNA wybutosine-synthesizing protein 2